MRRQLTLFEAAGRSRTDARPARRILPVCKNSDTNDATGKQIRRLLLNRPPCNGTDTSNEAARRIRPVASL